MGCGLLEHREDAVIACPCGVVPKAGKVPRMPTRTVSACRDDDQHRMRPWAMVLGLVVLCLAGTANAQPVDVPPPWGGSLWDRPRLTGSWFGLRDAMGEKGVGCPGSAQTPTRSLTIFIPSS